MLVSILGQPRSWTRSFGAARRRFEACQVHPDGERMFGVEHDGSVRVFELASGRELAHLTTLLSAGELEEARGVALALHPNQRWLFSTVAIVDCGDVTHAWDLETYALLDRYEYPRGFGYPVGDHDMLSPHGLSLTLWDLATGATLRTLERRDISWHVLGVIGDHALVAGRSTLELWDVRTGQQRWTETGEPLAAVTAAHVVIARPGQLELREPTGAVVRRIALPLESCHALEIAGDRAIVTARGECVVIELASGLATRISDDGALTTVQGDAMATWSWQSRAAVWSLATGACRLRAPVELALSPDGARAYGIDGARIREWAVDGRDVRDETPPWLDLAISTVPDALLGRTRDGVIHVAGHDGHTRHQWGPAPAGAELAGARLLHVADRTARILDATTGIPSYELPGVLAATLSRSGDLLAGMTRRGVSIWRLGEASPTPVVTLQARSLEARPIALEGDRVALAHETSIELWRIAPPLRLHTFRSITRPTCAAFDPSLRWMASGHDDGAVLIRDLVQRSHHATLATAAGLPIGGVALSAVRIAVWSVVLEVWELDRPQAPVASWDDARVHQAHWLDDDTLACATSHGLVVLRLA